MSSQKTSAGSQFPEVTVPKLGGGELLLGTPQEGHDWKIAVIYRGKHCPMCTSYLKELEALLPEFHALGVDVVAVSADTEAKATDQMALVQPSYPVGYDLSVNQMHELGLYVSDPRSAEETDRPFAEPGIFVVNANGQVQVTDISNAPFARPDLKTLLGGLRFIRNPENNYPIRGTRAA
ncbi:redoxin domain-containing protein [Ruegeria sp. A3M17]|uniref:redoxin domain-containing protein n=1 Tax=Ruegeria sp. A3M17 TaxID=2267229 RepID=UPI000DE83303|nr:redoxin domain-containing protein [Ruegeria sp. A3M17]RBW52557.1 thioredoxin peroxidase [Ruegeria sp. A3M17]